MIGLLQVTDFVSIYLDNYELISGSSVALRDCLCDQVTGRQRRTSPSPSCTLGYGSRARKFVALRLHKASLAIAARAKGRRAGVGTALDL